jgi:hypothetical protein
MNDPTRDRDKHEPDSSPYGPQPHGVDEAAGGADSSPLDNVPSGEKGRAAEEDQKKGRRPASGPS